jgi:hypothetical protein
MLHVVEDPSFLIRDSGSRKKSHVFSLCYKRINNGNAGKINNGNAGMRADYERSQT